ncbi:MAG: TonB-dependent receptor, partial [Cyclobacteriaceae bacterium]
QVDHTYQTKALLGNLTIRNGGGFRNDIVTGNELSRTINRKEISDSIALGDINEFNGFLFSDYTWERGKWTLNAGVRMDQFQFQEVDLLQENYDRVNATKYIVSPKFNVIYTASRQWQFYAKSGKGFHSNDTRVVVENKRGNTLPAAYGFDLGTIYRPFDRLLLDVAYWQLHLEQEFVYVGDEGVVEAGGRTRREGLDVGLNYQLTDHLFLYGHMNYADPRSVNDPEGENYIPLAPTLTSSGGLTYQQNGFSGSVTWRYLKDRAANEDNSVVADGYFLTDLNLNYDRTNWGIQLSVENLFNTDWREAQFDTESQLQGEAAPVSEIHFTPGTPFFAKAGVVFKF